MTKPNRDVYILSINLFIYLTSLLLSSVLKVPLAIFVCTHLLVIFIVLRKTSHMILAIRSTANKITIFILLEALFTFFSALHMFFGGGLSSAIFLLFFRLLINIFLFVILFMLLSKFMHYNYSYLIILEYLFIGSILSVLVFSNILPTYNFSEGVKVIDVFSMFMNILDYSLLLMCLSFSIFMLKYQQRYLIKFYYPLILSFVSISYSLSNIYCLNKDYFRYNILLSIFVLSVILYRYFIEALLNDPIAEIMKDADSDYKISKIKNSNLVYLVFIIANGLFILFLVNLLSTKLYAYFITIFLAYVVISLKANRSLVNKLLIEKERNSKERMNEIIKNRNWELLKANAKLEYLATHDKFTKLSNRFSFISEVGNLINKENTPFSFILISFENLKEFRNLYGSEKSLKLLFQFLDRLKEFLDKEDYIYQLSSYEIAIISTSKTNNEDSMKFFDYFYNSLEYLSDTEYVVEDVIFYLQLKVALVRYPEDVSTLKELFIVSDLMSFKYKKDSKLIKNLKTAEGLIESLRTKNNYSSMLKEAKYDDEFLLYYQPQFDIISKKIIGCEALIRWKKDGKFISPGIFIPIAESSGLIYNISVWVGKTAVKQMKEWKEFLADDFKLGINVSPLILESYNFFTEFSEEVKSKGLSFKNFDFEITEHSELANSTESLLVLNKINSEGVSISIDDFGTGYSSLSYVRMYSVGKIKIAKELIDEISTDEEYKYMVEGIINMSKTLGMKTIAEGVEYEDQLEILRSIACDEIQGYIWGKPVPAEEFEKLYKAQA